MNKIRILQPNLANKIAAGEVVDRPMSVVKELLENAVDAGSTAITIEIRGGGIEYIRVTDNGNGIATEDAPLAFERHATSKISTVDDLTHIETLGFRGEALSSIAAVADVRLRSRISGAEVGTELSIKGGTLIYNRPSGCPEGTSIEVSDLFYNVPARLKFLKAARTEAGYISDYVSRMILAHPEISIRLISNQKTVYESTGDGDLQTAVYSVYGNSVLTHLRKLDFDDGYIAITGYIGTEEIAKPTRQHQSFFVNGRYIRSTRLSFAVQRAYDTRLMVGKYPFAVLDIKISSREVDVNVHPNKLEVRFRDEDRVMSAVTIASRRALGDYVPPTVRIPEKKEYKVSEPAINTPAVSSTISTKSQIGQSAENNRPFDRMEVAPKKVEYPHQSLDHIIPTVNPLNLVERPAIPEVSEAARTLETFQPIPLIKVSEPVEEPVRKAEQQIAFEDTSYVICGKVFETYWIVQQRDSVFFIDQHAAHERKLYEQLINQVEVESQQLLTPIILRLTALEYQTWQDGITQFEELGFVIEEFGALTVCIRAVPYILGEPQAESFLHDALAALVKNGRVAAKDLKRDAVIQSACKHAVKAGNVLSQQEIQALISEFAAKGVPLTCPHGRPVMVRMSQREFEKMFKRVL